MSNKRLIPVVALLLLAAAAVIAGASTQSGVRVPPGQIVESPGARKGDAARPAVPAAPALPAASGDVTFSDDFSKSGLAGWESLAQAPGTWLVRDGRLQQRGDANAEVASDAAVLVNRSAALGNGTLEAQVYATSGEPVGVVFRGSDAGYYRVSLYQNVSNDASKALLERVTSSGNSVLASTPVAKWAGYAPGQWHRIAVSAAGSRITVTVDGTQLFDVNDNAYSTGWVGVRATADMGSQFDNVRVQSAAGR